MTEDGRVVKQLIKSGNDRDLDRPGELDVVHIHFRLWAEPSRSSSPSMQPADDESESPTQLKFVESVPLDALGPLIINADGTTRRIINWRKMTVREQQVTLRRITKRNRKRVAALKEKQEKQKTTRQAHPDEL